MKTVKEYCTLLGWTPADLARQAGISWEPANKAINAEDVSARIKRQIADAFSKATGETIKPGNIQW